MSDEVAKEVVQIAIRTVGKPTVEIFMKALKEFVAEPTKKQIVKEFDALGEVIHPTHGKQDVKTLIGQGAGVTKIPLASEGTKEFQRMARKYGVDFSLVKDKDTDPSVYTLFFKSRDNDAITKILEDYAKKQLKGREEKSSLQKELQKKKSKVASLAKDVLEKRKVIER